MAKRIEITEETFDALRGLLRNPSLTKESKAAQMFDILAPILNRKFEADERNEHIRQAILLIEKNSFTQMDFDKLTALERVELKKLVEKNMVKNLFETTFYDEVYEKYFEAAM